MRVSFKGLPMWRVMATVFAVFVAGSPTALAVRKTSVDRANRFMEKLAELKAQEAASGTIITEESDGSITVTRFDRTYVLSELIRDPDGIASGRVTVYDANGQYVEETFSLSVAVQDGVIKYGGVITTPPARGERALPQVSGLSGTLALDQSSSGLRHFTSQPDGVGGVSYGQTCPVDNQSPNPDGSGSDVAFSFAGCVAVGVVVVIFVLATCLIFGWWGC